MNTNKFPWVNGGTIEIEVIDGIPRLTEYDDKGNLIHFKDSDGYETWREYDAKGNQTHYKSSTGYESWYEYDAKGNQTHFKNSNGDEYWYDDNGEQITKKEFDRIHSPSPCKGKIVEIDGKKYKLVSA